MGKPDKDKRGEAMKAAKAATTRPALTSVHINVTPLVRDDPELVCRIEPRDPSDGAFVSDGLITLPPGPPFDLHFHLLDGENSQFAYVEFSDPPWSSRPRECPDPAHNDHAQFPHQQRVSPKEAVVRAVGMSPNARHYSLNFSDNLRCDPIIIRD